VRRSKRNRWLKRLMWAAVPLVLALGAGGWWYLHGGRWTSVAVARASAAVGTPQPEAARSDDQSPLIVELPDSTFTWPAELGGPTEVADKSGGGDDAEARGATSAPALSELPNPPPEPPREAAGGALKDDEHSGNPTIEAARKRQAEGHPIEARHELNALLQQRGLSRTDQVEVRKLLTVLADETVLSNRRLPDDPLTDVYVVQSGDVLLRIGRQFKVPAEILMQINGIKNAASLRAEQKIKVLKGPFHAKIYKSDFRLDVYLQDLYVRSFRVGLGADQGTPEGLWRVKERLQHPSYYPSPASAGSAWRASRATRRTATATESTGPSSPTRSAERCRSAAFACTTRTWRFSTRSCCRASRR
jgi:LysM repeat protein